jgi:hypothetical protein
MSMQIVYAIRVMSATSSAAPMRAPYTVPLAIA